MLSGGSVNIPGSQRGEKQRSMCWPHRHRAGSSQGAAGHKSGFQNSMGTLRFVQLTRPRAMPAGTSPPGSRSQTSGLAEKPWMHPNCRLIIQVKTKLQAPFSPVSGHICIHHIESFPIHLLPPSTASLNTHNFQFAHPELLCSLQMKEQFWRMPELLICLSFVGFQMFKQPCFKKDKVCWFDYSVLHCKEIATWRKN